LARALDLELALRHVVDHAIARDMVERFGFVDVFAGRTDHHAELDFPIGLDRTTRNNHGVVGAAYRTRGFEEQHRLRRYGQARFCRMVGIVEADADEFADPRHTCAQARIARHERQAGGVDFGKPGKAGRRQGFASNVVADLR